MKIKLVSFLKSFRLAFSIDLNVQVIGAFRKLSLTIIKRLLRRHLIILFDHFISGHSGILARCNSILLGHQRNSHPLCHLRVPEVTVGGLPEQAQRCDGENVLRFCRGKT